MGRLARVSGMLMVDFLGRQGFRVVRTRGSHHVMERGALRTVVPVHQNDALKVGTLRGILRDVQMSPAEFERAYE